MAFSFLIFCTSIRNSTPLQVTNVSKIYYINMCWLFLRARLMHIYLNWLFNRVIHFKRYCFKNWYDFASKDKKFNMFLLFIKCIYVYIKFDFWVLLMCTKIYTISTSSYEFGVFLWWNCRECRRVHQYLWIEN